MTKALRFTGGLIAAMALVCPLGSAFVTPALSARTTPSQTTGGNKPTSTTLYYRDDVPPIGSTPTWETPNDFNQFLTQCSIQSFMFLLHSLRDDRTVRWLDDFTDPVLQSNSSTAAAAVSSSSNTPGAATKKSPPPRTIKVSLEQAALSAVVNTDKVMTEALAKDSKKKKKTKRSKKITKTTFASKQTTTDHAKKNLKKKALPPSIVSMRNLLNEKVAIKNAFSSLSMMKLIMAPQQPEVEDAPQTANTDISALYSSTGIPTRHTDSANTTGPKNKYAPYAPYSKKVRNTDRRPKPRFVAGRVPRPSLASTASCTSYLYGAPEKKVPEPATTDNSSNTTTAISSTGASNSAATAGTTTKRRKKVLKYHGLAILNCTKFPTWESYFEQLLEQPKECFLIESLHPTIPSYDFDIDPASLCRRMLSVRTQIADEFAHDLDVIARMGGLTLMSYHKMLREIREQRDDDKLQQQKDELEKQIPKSIEENISNHNGATATDDVDAPQPQRPSLQRANLLFLDSAVGKDGAANANYAPSPLRKGNFDLLVLLATQEAIHRVLNDPYRQTRKSEDHGSNQFLQDFYVARLLSHFSGDQRYGRADDFLEEMLESTPRMITLENEKFAASSDNNGERTTDLTYLVDPVKVAESILDAREKVALEWKEQVADETKAAHMAIQKLVLAKIMGGLSVDEFKIVDPGGNELEDEDDTDSCFE